MVKSVVLGIGIRFGIVGFTSIHLQAQSSFTATYAFGSVTTSSGTIDPTPPPAVTGVTFGSFSAVGYTGNPNASGRFSWTSSEIGGINGDDNFADFTGSLNAGKYYEVTLSPIAGYALNIDGITFGVRRSASGIRSYAVRSSLDGFSASITPTISPLNPNLGVGPDDSFRWMFDATSTAADQAGSRLLLDAGFDVLTSPVTFRFYGWNAEVSSGTFSIDDVQFSGDITEVPEPGVGVMLPSTLVLFALSRWLRKGRPPS